MTSGKVGVIGSGAVGKVLAQGFARHGWQVKVGSRSPEKLAEWAEGAGVGTGTFEEVSAFGDVIVLAVGGLAAAEALDLAGATNLDGKVVIDATNPLAAAPPTDGVLSMFTGPNESLMERLQAQVPGARFVKAFSCVGNAFMVNPTFAGGRATMFICGNDAAAKAVVVGILDTFGWDSEDLGRATGARAIEPLVQLWCAPGFLRGDWAHAFKVVRPIN